MQYSRSFLYSFLLLFLSSLLAACGGSGSSVERGDAGFVVGDVVGSTVRPGSVAEFEVRLATRPEADVRLPLSSSAPDLAVVAPSYLLFTADDWERPQKVTATGVDENLSQLQQRYQVRLGAASSSDRRYDGLDPADVEIGGLLLQWVGLRDSGLLVAGVPHVLQPIVEYNGDAPLAFELLLAPPGMTIDAESGELQWTPPTAGVQETLVLRVTDGDAVDDLELQLEVQQQTALALQAAAADRVVVNAASSPLNGLSLTMAGIDPTSASVSQLVAEPPLPGQIATLLPAFVLSGPSKAATLRLPQLSLPADVDVEDVQLWVYDQSMTDSDTAGWTPLILEVGFEGTADNPVVVVPLDILPGLYVVGYDRDELAGLASSRPAAARTAAEGTVSCSQIQPADGRRGRLELMRCVFSDDPGFDVLVRGFSRLHAEPALTIEELAGWLHQARQRFEEMELSSDARAKVLVHPLASSRILGYVSSRQNYRVLHLNTSSLPKAALQGTVVHEYFHQAQARSTVAGLDNLLQQSGRRKQWLTEGLARWFEDDLFDDLNSYRFKERLPLPRVLERGFAALNGTGLRRPYARFALWKLVAEDCGGFTGSLKLLDLLNAELSTDRFALDNLATELRNSDCNFGNGLGFVDRSSLDALLVKYQYATLVENDVTLIDSNESKTVLEFDQVDRLFAASWWSPRFVLDGLEERYVEQTVGRLAPSAASFIKIAGSESQVPEGQVAYLKVSSTGADVVVSISSKSPLFTGDSDLQIVPGNPHRVISTEGDGNDELQYDFSSAMPELLVSVVNTDTAKAARVRLGFGVRNVDGRPISWHSPVACNESNEAFAWRWVVSLWLSGSTVRGGIYFHDCPGGGRASYSVSGSLVDGKSPFYVSGSKLFGGGDLGEEAPDSLAFTLRYGQTPSPALAH